MSRRFRTLELMTAADLARGDLAREQERTARDVANTNRWIGALSSLIPAGVGIAEKAYGAASTAALDDAKTFASNNPEVRGGDDVNDAIDADPSMQVPKSTGNWADDFLANPFGVKGALATKKRNAATQLLNDQAAKNRAADKLAADHEAELARAEQVRAAEVARQDKIRADDIALADRRRGEDAEMRAFQIAHDDEQKAKDRRSADIRAAADRAARAKERQDDENARAAQRAADKAAEQARRDDEYRRNLTDKQRQQVAEVENFRTNIKDNIARLKQQIADTGTFELTGTESADMERRITAIATDMAKLADPGSVAREGEVATAKKGLFPTDWWGSLTTRNGTAQGVLDNLANEVDQRAANAYRVQGLPPPSSPTAAPATAPAAATPKADPLMIVQSPDGRTKIVPLSKVPPDLADGWVVTEAH